MPKPIIVLGINYGGHDTSAALMSDGELVAACEQERYSGDKHSRKFPIDAISDCFQQSGILLSEVDKLAFAFDPIYHIAELYLRPALKDPSQIQRIILDIDRIKENYNVEAFIREQTQYRGPIEYFNHHECHLASTYYPSGFKEALLVSYDGIGEHETGMFGVGRDGSIEIVHKNNVFPNSLGLLYSAITFYLGWRHHCDEGIVMGLATYGNPNELALGSNKTYKQLFDEIIELTGVYDYEIDKSWIGYHKERNKWVGDKFYESFGPKREADAAITQHHKNIAAALQIKLEEVTTAQLTHLRNEMGLRRLCLSGGVALNCSMNGTLAKLNIFDEIFVQPASGDAGVAVGACFLASKQYMPELKPKKQHNFYLGSAFSDTEVEHAITRRNLPLNRPANIYTTTAEYLKDGKIIGWFQGRAEFGPRALGNRSILTRPYPENMKDYLNSRVKFREEFRPFAPAVLAEYLEEYFEIRQESPHMLIACEATRKAIEEIPATVHVDNTCRVQSVTRENNERFYKLLSAFNKITECPVLLNTSFNVKGQPIVNSPEQAIDCYLATNIDCLILGDYLLEKLET